MATTTASLSLTSAARSVRVQQQQRDLLGRPILMRS